MNRRRVASLLRYRNLVAVLVLVTFGLRLWSVSRWSWNSDDWIYMHDASVEPLLVFVFQNYNGHFMPGQFLVVWVLNAVAPLDHAVVAVVTAVWAALLAGLWAVALRHLSGTGVVTWAVLLLVTLTPLQVHPTMWWAAALQTLALQTCLAACLYFAVRLVDTGGEHGRRGLVLSYVVGLLMWEKALFLLLPVLVVLLHRTPGPALTAVRRYRTVLVWLGGLSAAYLAVFLAAVRISGPPSPNAVRPDPVRSFGDIAGFYYDLWAHLLAPGLLGGPWSTLPTPVEFDSHPSLPVQLATLAGLVALATWLLVRDRRAWMPLAAAVLYAGVAWGTILFSSRYDVVSWHRLGYERYAIDAFVVLVVMLGVAAGRPGTRSVPAGADRGVRRIVAAGAVLALAVSLAVASTATVVRFGVSPTKAWLANLDRGTGGEGGVDLVDRHAPDDVMPATFWGDRARLSYLLAPWRGDRVRFQGPAPELHLVDEEGRVLPTTFAEAARSVPGPVPDCGYAVSAEEPVVVDMEPELFDHEWVLEVDAYAGSAGTLLVRGEEELQVPLPAGMGSHQMVVTGTAESFELQMSEESGTACVTTLSVGTLAPR